MFWNQGKGKGGRICLASFGVLLAILSLANSDGSAWAGEADTTTGNTPVEAIDDVESDGGGGEGVIVDEAVVEEEDDLHPVDERIRLFQYDPVEVGHIRYVEISPGRYVQLKTIAVKPPAFEIPHFLTHEECERLKEIALERGLFTSATLYKSLGESGIDETKVTYNATEWETKFAECDNNTDYKLDFDEVLLCLPGLDEGEVIPPATLEHLYLQLTLDLDSNGFIDAKELWLIHLENKTTEIKEWLSRWRAGELPKVKERGRGRISEQAWIGWGDSTDPTVIELRDRVTALTRIDRNIILSSESIQVVRYYPGGHYHAHWDSEQIDPDVPCGHTKMYSQQSRLCRYITILYYLHDVEGGGETAFPLAEFENVSAEYTNNLGYDHVDLRHNCHKNLNIKPEYGKAIMWYNHFIDEETGWLSSLNRHTLHGGCDVTKGIKWIANNWITVDDVYERQMAFHALKFPTNQDGEVLESEDETDGDEKDNRVEEEIYNEADDEEKEASEKDLDVNRANHANEKLIVTEDISESAPSNDKIETDDPLHEHSDL